MANLATRSIKNEVDRSELLAEWKRIGREHGFALEEEFFTEQRGPRAAPEVLVEAGIERALARITEHEAHFGRRDLLQLTADELETSCVGLSAIVSGVDRFIEQSPELVRLRRNHKGVRFTTREMLRVEAQMLERADGLAARRHGVGEGSLSRVLSERPSLSQEQRHAVSHLANGQAFSIVSGMAGTGKSFALESARMAWEAAGFKVRGAALAAAASKRLEDDTGIHSRSIARTLSNLERGRTRLTARHVLVVDEAGLVGTRQMERLLAQVEAAGAKLVLVGDERQLAAIEAGGPFKALAREHGSVRLTEIRRQREDWAKEVVRKFAAGAAEEAVAALQERGQFQILGTRAESIEALVSDWQAAVSRSSLKDTFALTGTRLDAVEVNRAIQAARRARGELGHESVALGPFVVRAGDRVVFKRNKGLFMNGEMALVVGLDAANHEMRVRRDDGQFLTVDLRDYSEIELGYAATTHWAQGATVEHCLVLAGGPVQHREATYVQASRARAETRFYTDAESAGEELASLTRQMGQSRQKELATQLLEPVLEGA